MQRYLDINSKWNIKELAHYETASNRKKKIKIKKSKHGLACYSDYEDTRLWIHPYFKSQNQVGIRNVTRHATAVS